MLPKQSLPVVVSPADAESVWAVALPVVADTAAAENVSTVVAIPAALEMHWMLLCLLHSVQCHLLSLRWLEQFVLQDVCFKLVHGRSRKK